MKCFVSVARLYKKLVKLQSYKVTNAQRDKDISASRRSELASVNMKLTALMQSIYLQPARLEELEQQLSQLHRHIGVIDMSMLKLAQGCGVPRASFLEAWFGS